MFAKLFRNLYCRESYGYQFFKCVSYTREKFCDLPAEIRNLNKRQI